MIQSQVFWLRGKPLRNIQPFNGFAPMQDIERLLNKMFPKNSALVLILLHARKLDGRFYLSGGSWSVLWPGSTIPAVFPKTMKCLSVLHKLFAPLLLSALYSSGFSLLVQLLRASPYFVDAPSQADSKRHKPIHSKISIGTVFFSFKAILLFLQCSYSHTREF